jgi:hypothetical protein
LRARYRAGVTTLTLALVLFWTALAVILVIAGGVLAFGPDSWYRPPLGGEMTRAEIVRTVLLFAVGPAAIAIGLTIAQRGHALVYTYLTVGVVARASEIWLFVWFVATARRRTTIPATPVDAAG